MAVNTEITTHSYSPGAAMAAEGIPFPFLQSADLRVTHVADADGARTVLTLNSDYAIGGDGAAQAGTITPSGAWPTADLWLIERVTELKQKALIAVGQPLPAADLTRTLDKAMMGAQENRRDIDAVDARAVTAPLGDTLDPISGDRPGKVIGFGADPDKPIMLTMGGADLALRVNLAEDGGPLVGIVGRAPGIIRSFQDIMEEGLGLKKDFGAVGNRTTSDNSALKMAFDDCVPNGFHLQIPRGTYRFHETLGGAIRAFDPNTLGAYGFSLDGAGTNQCVLYFDGDPADDAITLTGTSAGGDNVHIGRLALVRPATALSSGATGAGWRLNRFTNCFLRELYTFGHGTGLAGLDTKQIDVNGFWSRYDDRGVDFGQGTETGPNLVSMTRWSILAPATGGARFTNGACVRLADGGVEGCAVDRGSGNYKALEIFQPGSAGAAAVHGHNLYFENNRGTDIYLTPTNIGCTWKFGDVTAINRVEPYSTRGIVFDADSQIAGGPTQVLDIGGVGFLSTITPSGSTPFVEIKTANGYDGLIFDDSKTLYPNTIEMPSISASKVRHISAKGTTTAAAFIAGAGGFVGTPRGVVSTARTGAGVYTITMPRPVITGSTPLFIPSFVPQNVAGVTLSYVMSGSVITVTFTVGATPTDVSFAFSGTYV